MIPSDLVENVLKTGPICLREVVNEIRNFWLSLDFQIYIETDAFMIRG